MKRALPGFDFSEQHETFIRAATPGPVLDLVSKVDPTADPFIRRTMLLRELPGRIAGRFANSNIPRGRPILELADFLNLGRLSDREVAFGLAGHFWQLDYGLIQVPSMDAFSAWHENGAAKVVIGFAANPLGNGVRLVTRTEVSCLDSKALREFGAYWLLIRLVSGFLRKRWLGLIKASAEHPLSNSLGRPIIASASSRPTKV